MKGGQDGRFDGQSTDVASHQPSLLVGFGRVGVDVPVTSRIPGTAHVDDIAGIVQAGERVRAHAAMMAAERER